MPRIQTLIEEKVRDPQGKLMRTGRIIGVDLRRIGEYPYYLQPNSPNTLLVAAANQVSPPQVMTVSLEGPAMIDSLAAQFTNVCRVTLQLQDGTQMRGMMNGAIHISALFGSGAQPYMLPESLYIDENRHLVATVTDISGLGTSVRLAARASRFTHQAIDPKLERIRKRLDTRQYVSMPYFYTLDAGPVTIPAGTTIQQAITIGQDFHFNLMQLSVVATSMAFDINIFDVTKGESIIDGFNSTNFPISAGLLLGNGNFPFRFHEPIFFQAGTKLQVTLTDRSLVDNVIHLCAAGSQLANKMWK